MTKKNFVGQKVTKEIYNLIHEDGNAFVGADFTRCDLRGLDFCGFNLNGVIFDGCDLSGVDLSLTKCNDASFVGANLEGCDLSESSFIEANFERANLTDCDLRFANLYAANLKSADLSNSNLKNANFNKASMEHTNIDTMFKPFEQNEWLNRHFTQARWDKDGWVGYIFIENSINFENDYGYYTCRYGTSNSDVRRPNDDDLGLVVYTHEDVINMSCTNHNAWEVFIDDLSGIVIPWNTGRTCRVSYARRLRKLDESNIMKKLASIKLVPELKFKK